MTMEAGVRLALTYFSLWGWSGTTSRHPAMWKWVTFTFQGGIKPPYNNHLRTISSCFRSARTYKVDPLPFLQRYTFLQYQQGPWRIGCSARLIVNRLSSLLSWIKDSLMRWYIKCPISIRGLIGVST